MPKKKRICDEAQLKWFEQTMDRIKKATGPRTQVQLAEVLDVRQSSISDAKRRCSIPPEWFLKLYRSYGLDPDWLSEGVGVPYINEGKGKVDAKKLSTECHIAQANRQNARGVVIAVSTEAGQDKKGDTWKPNMVEELCIPESFVSCVDLAVVKVESASMYPNIIPGAFVGIDMNDQDFADGDLIAVHFQNHGLAVRRAYIGNGRFLLTADNDDRFDTIQVKAEEMSEHVVGRVQWIIQKAIPF